MDKMATKAQQVLWLVSSAVIRVFTLKMVSFTLPKRLKEKVYRNFSKFDHIVVKMFFVGTNTLLVSDPATVIVI